MRRGEQLRPPAVGGGDQQVVRGAALAVQLSRHAHLARRGVHGERELLSGLSLRAPRRQRIGHVAVVACRIST